MLTARRIVAGSWFATLMFMVSTALIIGIGIGWNAISDAVVSAFVLTPGIWWAVVARHPRRWPLRGAGAGAAIGVGTVLLPFLIEAAVELWLRHGRPYGRGEITGLAYVVVVIAALIAIPVGAVIGCGTAYVQSTWLGGGRS